MPQFRLADLVADARAALRLVRAAAPSWGADPSRLTVSGHSAGAHLACYLAAAPAGEALSGPAPWRLLLLSGIYDPAPLRESILQREIGLTEEECRTWAPVAARLASGTDVTLLVGDAETAPFHSQARALAARWSASVQALAGEDHMSIVHSLGVTGTAAQDALARTIGWGPESSSGPRAD